MATQHGNSYLPLDQQADQAKAGIRERLQAGETISYSHVGAIDDMRWDELCKELNVIEVPGTGYRVKTSSKVIINGKSVDFDAAVNLMDDELREHLHSTVAWDQDDPRSYQNFANAYCVAHAKKFGEDFRVD